MDELETTTMSGRDGRLRMISIDEEKSSFGVMDYMVFMGMLCISTGIGIFYAFKSRKNTTSKDFLTSNRSLGVFPVAMSLLASFQSSVTILGYPAEMFYRGTQFWVVILSGCLAAVVAAELFLPVYYRLNFTSVNQYLAHRYSSEAVRLAVSASFLLATIPYMGVVLYGPSLALGSVTPLSVESSIFLIGMICTFYTSMGGIKAVVWTDVVQVFLMFAGLLAVMIRGFYLVGGVGEAFRIANEGGRIQFLNVEVDPYSTSNLWNAVLGMGIMWCGNYCTSQTEVQRYCNVRTQKKARIALYWNMAGMICLISCACLCGVALYGYYATCDPLALGVIRKTDQLMPYFVMDQLHHIPGMAGLFVACVFSASLSTMSSGFNALATVTWDDFLGRIPCVNHLSERAKKRLNRLIALIYGLGAVGMAFLVAQLNSVLQAAISIAGALVGPTLAVYLLGMLCPLANATGAIVGLLTGELFGLWTLVGSVMYSVGPRSLDTSLQECPTTLLERYRGNDTTTTVHMHTEIHTGLNKLYHMAYLLVPVNGFLITLTIGFLVSVLTGGYKQVSQLNTELMSPLIFKLWPSQCLPVRKLRVDKEEPSLTSGGGGGGGSRSRSGSMKMTILSLKKKVVEHGGGSCVGVTASAGGSYVGLPTSEGGRPTSMNDLLAESSTSSQSSPSRSSSQSQSVEQMNINLVPNGSVSKGEKF